MTALERLRAAVNAMTPGPWSGADGARLRGAIDATVDGHKRQVMSASGEAPAAEDSAVAPDAGARAIANAAGVVALRNAAGPLLDLAEAVQAWRDAECETQSLTTDDVSLVGDGECVGDNHDDSCPLELARQNMIAASDKVKAL